MRYEAPEIHVLGSLAELTAFPVNKIGANADGLADPNLVVGSPTPIP